MKPTWDEYFIDMAYLVASRSIDPSTKQGCIVVSEDHTVLSVGYNSPPRDCRDEDIPLIRPEKYAYLIHAEENSMLNAARKGIALEGSTFYVTGIPCSRCFRGILNVGAKRIIHGPNGALMYTSEHDESSQLMNTGLDGKPKVELIAFKGRIGAVMFETTKQYMEKKFGNCIIDTQSSLTINHSEE